MEREEYSTAEAGTICGLSKRQLQWLDERGIVSPRQAGHRRIYVIEELLAIAIISELRSRGISLLKLGQVARSLQKGYGRRLTAILESRSAQYVVTDGASVYIEDARARVVDRLLSASRPMAVVLASEQAQRILAAAEQRSATASRQIDHTSTPKHHTAA